MDRKDFVPSKIDPTQLKMMLNILKPNENVWIDMGPKIINSFIDKMNIVSD